MAEKKLFPKKQRKDIGNIPEPNLRDTRTFSAPGRPLASLWRLSPAIQGKYACQGTLRYLSGHRFPVFLSRPPGGRV